MIELIVILDIIVFAITLRLAYLTIADNFHTENWISFGFFSLIPALNVIIMFVLLIMLAIDNLFGKNKKSFFPKKNKRSRIKRILTPFNGELVKIPINHFDILKENKIIKWSDQYKLYTIGKNEILEWNEKSKMFFVKKVYKG